MYIKESRIMTLGAWKKAPEKSYLKRAKKMALKKIIFLNSDGQFLSGLLLYVGIRPGTFGPGTGPDLPGQGGNREYYNYSPKIIISGESEYQ